MCKGVERLASTLRAGLLRARCSLAFSFFFYVSLSLDDECGMLWRGVTGEAFEEPKMGSPRLDDAIFSESGYFGGLAVACQAEQCSWLSGSKSIRADDSFMQQKQRNTHFAFAECYVA